MPRSGSPAPSSASSRSSTSCRRGWPGSPSSILRLQRELFVVGAELATNPDAWDRLQDGTTRVSAEMVEGIDALLRDLEAHVEMPREFIVPGETRTSAALELARTILRRAERRAVALSRDGLVPGPICYRI